MMKKVDLIRIFGIIKEKIQSAAGNLREDKRLRHYVFFTGLFFALSWMLGYQLRQNGRTYRTISELIRALPIFFFVTVVSIVLVCLFFAFLDRLWKGAVKSRILKKECRSGRVFVFYMGIIMLCWLPVFLAYYPSVFAYDANEQFYQFLAHDYSTHHPLLHTLFLGFFFKLGGGMPGSYSAGMAWHSVIQMLLMAAIFAYILMVLYQENTSWLMRFFLCLFYAFFPTNSILALSTTKDVLFSGFVLLYTMGLYQWFGKQYNKDEKDDNEDNIESNKEDSKKKRKDALALAIFTLLSVVMLLFRNNAIYAFLVSQPFIFLLGRKNVKRQYTVILSASILLFLLGSVGLKEATHAQNGSPREMLSVPLQQMARTRVWHEEEISSEMQMELDAYIPSEWVFATYNPYLADPVKNRAVIHDNPVGFMKAWMQLGMQFPMTYVDAFLDNSTGYWYLADTTHSTIYGKGTESGFGYLSTDNRPMPAGCEIIEHSYLPRFRAFMELIVSENEYQKIPVLSFLFAPAFYWWILCFYFAFFLYRKEYAMVVPVLFLIFYYFTLLLSPAALIRYMYPLVVTVPMMLCLVSAKNNKVKKYKNRQ